MNINIQVVDPTNFPTKRDMLNTSAYGDFGQPVYSDVHLKIKENVIVLTDILLTCTLKNTIITTPVTKRSGTVKEFISAQDYEVKMDGTVRSTSAGKFPVDDLKKLIKIINSEEKIDVYSEFLSLFNIHYLVLDKYEIKQRQGDPTVIDLSLTFDSDKDIQLIVE
jgi:hypothetical protein